MKVMQERRLFISKDMRGGGGDFSISLALDSQ